MPGSMLAYLIGDCVLSAPFESDTVVIACWALITVVSLVVLAWLKRPDLRGLA
jgi:hypothetical protein